MSISRRENRSRTIDKVAQRIRLNRTKLKSMQDTSTDYEELTNSIQAGYFIKNGIANYNEDLFYMSVFITVIGQNLRGIALAQAADGGYAQIHGYVHQRVQLSAGGRTAVGDAVPENLAQAGEKGAAQCADQRRRIQLYLHQL